MKTKNVEKKLVINKFTVASLDQAELKVIKGGIITVGDSCGCTTNCPPHSSKCTFEIR